MSVFYPATTQQEAEFRVRCASPCCPDAKRVNCVCITSVKCPRHGRICFGTHD